jgi:hypothetical protein
MNLDSSLSAMPAAHQPELRYAPIFALAFQTTAEFNILNTNFKGPSGQIGLVLREVPLHSHQPLRFGMHFKNLILILNFFEQFKVSSRLIQKLILTLPNRVS